MKRTIVLATLPVALAALVLWRQQEKRVANLERRVDGWSQWLQLDDYQRGRLRTVLTDQDAANAELLRMWEAGVDDESLSRAKAANQERHQAALAAFAQLLNQNQLQTFQQRVGADDRKEEPGSRAGGGK